MGLKALSEQRPQPSDDSAERDKKHQRQNGRDHAVSLQRQDKSILPQRLPSNRRRVTGCVRPPTPTRAMVVSSVLGQPVDARRNWLVPGWDGLLV